MKTFHLMLHLLDEVFFFLFFFVLVYEIWRFMKFQKQWCKNLRRSKDMLAEREVHEKNMTRTLQEMKDLEAILNQVNLEH